MTDERPDDPSTSETDSEEPHVDKNTIEDLDVPEKDAEEVEGGRPPIPYSVGCYP
ncbi:MAG: hypothetical protein QOE31_1756 [Solirubrobacteraceae bacterium]|jgi:hypothetical protein|nr:hypothetical protein [Solirubrobacteraceae bacterium]